MLKSAKDPEFKTVRMRGGLDTSAAPMSVYNGCCIGSSNYQERVVDGGYERVRGYERFDGSPRPSDSEITVLEADQIWSASATVGAIGTGAISGASGVICYWSETLLALTKVTGTFQHGEQILVGASPVGQANTSASVDALVLNEMAAGAEDIYRADIDTVPGTGPVCGVCVLAGEVYAFRNNFGGTAQLIYQATSSGWVAVPIHNKVRFTAGSMTGFGGGAFTLTQGGVTATVHRLMVETGDLLDGTAEGTMVIGEPTGGVLAAGAATGISGALTLDLAGAPEAITLAPSGVWQFKRYRFSLIPSAVDEVVYGVDRVTVDGVDYGGNFIEFDGSVLCPITAGGIDGPYRLETHKNHLFVVYRRTSVQFSSIGDPYRWSVLSGAGEMLAGNRVTELLSVQGSEDQAAMLVLCRDRSFVLYGNSSADFKLVPLSREVGAKQYSAQVLGQPIALDDQGMRSYLPTSDFGNFSFNTLTNHVRRDVVGKTPVASAIDSDGGRYRVYFDDGTWLSGTPGKRWSWMQCTYPFTVNFAQHWELDDEKVIFAGGESGYVYMLDRGRSFDGETITAWFKLAYAHLGSPERRKAFKRCSVEIRGESAGRLAVQCDYSYGDTAASANSPAYVSNNPIAPPATPWDLGTWNTGTWDSPYATLLPVRSEGIGENVSMTFFSESANEKSHHITTAMHFFNWRRMNRG